MKEVMINLPFIFEIKEQDYIKAGNLKMQFRLSILIYIMNSIETLTQCQRFDYKFYFKAENEHLRYQCDEIKSYIKEKVQKLNERVLFHFDEVIIIFLYILQRFFMILIVHT